MKLILVSGRDDIYIKKINYHELELTGGEGNEESTMASRFLTWAVRNI